MTTDTDLLQRLTDLADDLGPLATPREWADQLRALCATARLVLGAGAVSVAQTVDTGLLFVASSGPGAAAIEGTVLPAGKGLAGFVAASGQSLAIDHVQNDPRFARDVAESTGYVPSTLLVTPINGSAGDTIGVLSVLDRGTVTPTSSADALEVSTSFARQAALLLPQIDLLARLGPVLLRSLAISASETDPDLARALRHHAETTPGPNGDLARIAALLAELRTRNAETRDSVERVLTELLALTAPKRRR